MLRYFYLLCLLIYIKETFCYDHIKSKQFLKSKHLGQRLRKKESSVYENNNHKAAHIIKRRQGYGPHNDNDQFTQIDVASFIQKSDSYADNDLYDFKSLIPKPLNDYEELNSINIYNVKENHFNTDEVEGQISNPDFIMKKKTNIDNLEQLSKHTKFKNIFENDYVTANSIHDVHKKSSNQDMSKLQFPFFFRNEDSSPTISTFSTSKKKLKDSNSNERRNTHWQNEFMKTANKENTFSKSKNDRLKMRNDKRGLGQTILHNSRQYYQKLVSEYKPKHLSKETKLGKKYKDGSNNENILQTSTVQTSPSTKYPKQLHMGKRKLLRKTQITEK